MSRSVNKATLIGTLGHAPDVIVLSNGTPVANLSLATNEAYLDKNTNQKIENTEWHRVVMFGRLAEIAQAYLQQGNKIYIEGKLRTREWEKDGVKRYTTEIVANQMVMLSPKPEGSNQYTHQSQYAYQQQPQQLAPATPPPGWRPPQANNVAAHQYAQQQPYQASQMPECDDIPY